MSTSRDSPISRSPPSSTLSTVDQVKKASILSPIVGREQPPRLSQALLRYHGNRKKVVDLLFDSTSSGLKPAVDCLTEMCQHQEDFCIHPDVLASIDGSLRTAKSSSFKPGSGRSCLYVPLFGSPGGFSITFDRDHQETNRVIEYFFFWRPTLDDLSRM